MIHYLPGGLGATHSGYVCPAPFFSGSHYCSSVHLCKLLHVLRHGFAHYMHVLALLGAPPYVVQGHRLLAWRMLCSSNMKEQTTAVNPQILGRRPMHYNCARCMSKWVWIGYCKEKSACRLPSFSFVWSYLCGGVGCLGLPVAGGCGKGSYE